jgi:hypothetical protein
MSNSYRLRQLAFGLLVALFALTLGSSASAQTSTYKRKVVLEEFTGTWCQYCPTGAWVMDSTQRRMGDWMVQFAWHWGDDLTIPPGEQLATEFGVPGYPTLYQNRFWSIPNYKWSVNTPAYTLSVTDAKTAPTVDVRITNVKVVGSKVDFDVEVSPLDLTKMAKEDTSKYALFVGVTEDEVVRDQKWYNEQSQQVEILTDFIHHNVVRRVSTATQGDVFVMGTTTAVNTYPIKKHFSFTSINGEWKLQDLRLKAFVTNRFNKGGQRIQNADQTPHLGDLPEEAPMAIWTVTPAEDAEVVADKPAKIIWSKQGAVGNAKFEYSTNGGVNWSLVATDVAASPYAWTIPEPAIGQNVILRITDAGNTSVTSTSASFMVIAPVPVTAEVIQPMAGEKLRPGKKYMIQFTTSGEFGETAKLEYSTDGNTWNNITTVSNSETTYNWTVPNITSESVQVRVSNANGVTGISGTFSIIPVGTLSALTVNSGNAVPQNATVPVSWTASGDVGSKLKLEYSENGTTWNSVKSDIDATLTSYDWTTPDQYVPQARLRLSSVEGPSTSVGPFAIGVQGTEAVKLDGMPKMNAIAGNYPNPFATTSSIVYHIAQAGDVQLLVRDIMGKDVLTLESGVHQPGVYSTELNAADLAAGTYVVTLLINGEAYSRTVNVTK